jgi:large subunit ribosomal protein L13
MENKIIDVEDAVLGRAGSYIAKELLKGNSVFVINSEKIMISGSKEVIVEKVLKKRRMGRGGSLKGPKYIRQSDRLLKRMMRGMLPWDRQKGRDAYKRLICYVGNGKFSEDELKNVIRLEHKKPMKYIIMKELVEAIR